MNPEPAGILQLQQLVLRVINLSVGLAFIAVLCMLIYAGFRYLTSGGDQKAIQQAAMTITWALLGILFLGLGWILLKLVEAWTGVPVTNFCLGFPGAVTNCN